MDLSNLGRIHLDITVYEANLITEGLKRLINRTYLEHPQLGAEFNEHIRLSTQGLTETEIGQRLGISQRCVSLDLQYMECMAAERMKEHIEKTIPSVHAMCEDGLRQVLKIAWNSINNRTNDMKPSELTQKLALIA